MAADKVQRHAGHELGVAVVKAHPAFVNAPHHADHVLDVEGAAEASVAHVAARCVAHFQVLEMQHRPRKKLEIAYVIIVQMRDHDVSYGCRLDPQEA